MAIILIYSLKSPQGAESGVSVVGVDQGSLGASAQSAPGEGDEIVKILSMLSGVSLKTDLFENQLFLSLEDLSISPAEGEMGRNNPFDAY